MSDIETLFDRLEAFAPRPLDDWHPQKTVDMDIRIDIAGVWHYQGTPIRRHRIAKLFATLLRLEGGDFYLVTPPVKYKIGVDDAPFLAVEMNSQGQGVEQNLYFRTNMDEVVLADREHPIMVEIDSANGQPSPYIGVRSGLNAKITRSVFHQMAELAVPVEGIETGGSGYALYSAGTRFMVG